MEIGCGDLGFGSNCLLGDDGSRIWISLVTSPSPVSLFSSLLQLPKVEVLDRS